MTGQGVCLTLVPPLILKSGVGWLDNRSGGVNHETGLSGGC
jgi:hypothetical protein